MKKQFITAILIGLISINLVACGNSKSTDSAIKADTAKSDSSSKSDTTKSDSSSKDDVWTYFNGTTWSDDYNGLKLEIEKAVTTDKAPAQDGSDKKASAVGVKLKLTNNTKEKFCTYPDQAVLVTSTGEQIDLPSLLASDNLGGEIDEGVTKEGNIIWYLKKDGTAKDITWIKLSWDTRKGAEDKFDEPIKKYEIKLELKK
ncbi:hypothetical protein CLPUN_33010 [Clostridium puniceum]|uniref:DUF4352 domain-containing protein n=1 Tax=Clostridium puniceum TaxID=29367 RepID=A0A1S8TD60_9CLOT|nr:hypothetical protein [Clostridium puniceum]OOM75355.1 hypothetical protein CLPUN_33010 [Clostridium puniceum]